QHCFPREITTMDTSLAIRSIGLACAGVVLSSCGGGGSGGGGTGGGGGSGNSNPTYTIGGTLSGLDATAGSLVLQNNGADDLTIAANGAFSFAAPVASGGAYTITIKSQPTLGPLQVCSVTNGSGTVASAAVASVAVTCATRMAKFLYVPNSGSQN